jgi:hypothetical protein
MNSYSQAKFPRKSVDLEKLKENKRLFKTLQKFLLEFYF